MVALGGGHGGEAVQDPGHRELVTLPADDGQGVARQRFGALEVPELSLDHAQVRGLDPHEEVVPGRPAVLDALGDHVSRTFEVSRHLERHAQDVHHTRTPLPILGALGRGERGPQQPDRFGGIVVQRDASGAGQGEREHGRIPCRLGRRSRFHEPLLSELVPPGPEHEVAVVVERPRGSRAATGERSPEPLVAVIDPLRRHPERDEG